MWLNTVGTPYLVLPESGEQDGKVLGTAPCHIVHHCTTAYSQGQFLQLTSQTKTDQQENSESTIVANIYKLVTGMLSTPQADLVDVNKCRSCTE